MSGYARHYPNKLYNIKQTTATKHIYAGNQLVGTVEGSTLQYIHTDHLTGSNVATNTAGGMVQLLDYYPYGSMRVDWKSGSFDEQRKFTGHEFDRDTNLTYANARYYKQNVGRFLSQDTAFLAVGSPELKEITKLELRRYLENPQLANSYSYTTNNPLKHVDKSGEFLQAAIGAGIGFIGGVVSAYVSDVARNISNGTTGFNILQPQSSIKEYGLRAGQGAAVGAVVSTGGLLTPLLGGVVAGSSSILIDKSLGNEIDYKQAGIDAAITVGTAGLIKTTPKVPGRLPNIGTQAFFAGKHTQNQLVGEAVTVGVEYDTEIVSGLAGGLFQTSSISTAHYNDSGFGSSLSTPEYISQERKEGRP